MQTKQGTTHSRVALMTLIKAWFFITRHAFPPTCQNLNLSSVSVLQEPTYTCNGFLSTCCQTSMKYQDICKSRHLSVVNIDHSLFSSMIIYNVIDDLTE